DFIYNILPKLQQYCDIYYSENFKNLNLKNASDFSGGIRLNEKLDMLEFDFQIDGIDEEELYQVFKALKEKKKYYRLKDGSFLPLDSREIKDIDDMLNYLNVSKSDFKKEFIPIPKF